MRPVDPILPDHAMLHRRLAVVVCEGCHRRKPPGKREDRRLWFA
jgi:hypothetical protein